VRGEFQLKMENGKLKIENSSLLRERVINVFTLS